MPPATATRVLRVALIGNPNTGKSTLFTALAGVRQHVGNYPGVTVEKKTGLMIDGPRRYELIDLPGLYSLAVRSLDERVALDVLLGRYREVGPVHAVLCIADATNLRRNLYLLSQVRELGLPTVLVVNMTDVAERRGMTLRLERLQERLGMPVVAIQAHRGVGLERLRSALAEVIESPSPPADSPMPDCFEEEAARLEASISPGMAPDDAEAIDGPPERFRRFLARRLLLDVEGRLLEVRPRGRRRRHGWRPCWGEGDGCGGCGRDHGADESESHGALRRELSAARARLAEAGCAVPGVEPEARYAWARRVLDGVVDEPASRGPTLSDRLDRILTHRLLGTLVFAAIMFVMFQAVFVGAEPLMQGIDAGVGAAAEWVEARMAEGAWRSLVVDGVLGGVGGVLVFLPQILILFLFIGVLEDCGYMARAAYLMDRLMARIGLSGKSFIPMLSSFACAVPGIMAARVIEDERDRLTTILVAPLLTCSARLPVYALLIAAFVPKQAYLGGWVGLQGITLAALYMLGIVAAVVVALVLKRTLLRGVVPPFVLELPSYKWPSARTVAMRVGQRGWLFVRCAGTLILAVSILVWAALYFPRNPEVVEPLAQRQAALEAELENLPDGDPRREPTADELAHVEREIEEEYQRQSILGRLGRAIEPAVRPLGWDWRIGCAVLASFPAREIVVATMGVMYSVGDEVDADSEEGTTRLRERLRAATWEDTGEPVFTLPVALSIMVFFALCAQCAATLAVMRRETNSWRWPAFAFFYMTALAYVGALVTYQVGTWLAG